MSEFQFFPHPEAHPTKWDDLLPPLQEAMRELLLRLAGAVQSVKRSADRPTEAAGAEITASCFLVYGDRGTGKSTVLLSAQAAVCSEMPADFFGHGRGNKELWKDTGTSADVLRKSDLVWLDVLDMEPLPRKTNLLATLLVRLRNALYAPRPGANPPTPTSILEEGAGGARQKIERLIKDATLMWEDIDEPDTRNTANRQIDAADIYARFRQDFQSAMGALSKEIGRYKGRGDEYHPIVLPIDNIDRSTDHLYSIIKLAQMVACPYLWIVMAGDREDIETFLERAYWKELIRVGEGSGGIGKVGAGGEDEALVMARRQAAAASHKLLPPSHRIEVKPLRAEDTLKFPNNGGEAGQADRKRPSISDLLGLINIPDLGNGPEATLRDLFDAARYMEQPWKPEDSLTLAAKLALHLPARGVNNLWQLAYSAACDKLDDPDAKKDERGFKAEKVARAMLRNLVAESKMSSNVGQRLQDHVIQRFPGGATVLNFTDPNPRLKVTQLTATDFSRSIATTKTTGRDNEEPDYAVRSTLTIRGQARFVDFSLVGKPIEESGDGKGRPEKLPPLAAGWLAVLHDIVMWAPKSWVLPSGIDLSYLDLGRFVGVSHEVVHVKEQRRTASKPLWWPLPNWNSFLAYDVFRLKWKEWESCIQKASQENRAPGGDYLPRLLAVAWAACVLDTFWRLAPRKWMPWSWWPELGEDEGHERIKSESGKIASALELKPERMAEAFTVSADEIARGIVEAAEKKVIELAADLYCYIVDGSSQSRHRTRTTFFKKEGIGFMKSWLDQKLPLLLSCLYVPLSDEGLTQRREAMNKLLQGEDHGPLQKLAGAWKENSPFILADMETTMKDIFRSEERATEEKHEVKAETTPLDIKCIQGHLADLGELLNTP